MEKLYTENVMLKAPGLAIKAGGSTLVKAANACGVKCNGVLSTSIDANTDMPALTTAVDAFGATPAALETGHSRIYTFLASIGAPTRSAVAPVTFSVVASQDLDNPTTVPVKTEDIYLGNDLKKAVVGYLLVMNLSGSDFVPGTTALDETGVYTAYIDAYGFVGL